MSAAPAAAFRHAGEDLAALRLVVPGSGNLSVWTPDGVVITREGAVLHRLADTDLTLVARSTDAPLTPPSLDTPIHRGIYVTTGAKAVVHAHPAHAVALTLAAQFFEPSDLEGRHRLGRVPVVSPLRSVIEVITEAAKRGPVVIVQGHGVYTHAATLEEAVALTALLEESARIAWLAGLRG
jgi:L-fuculose-phosphate aldolase